MKSAPASRVSLSCLLALGGVLFSTRPGLVAAPVDGARVAALADDARPAWAAYLARSAELAAADEAALAAELKSLGLSAALKAPSGGDFRLADKTDAAWFAGEEAGALANVVLSYQTPSGGWSKHTGYAAGPRAPGMQWSSQYEPGKSRHYLATFDNHSTTAQLRLLAGVWRATGREDCRVAVLRGVDFILAAQYPNGGWPQGYPLEGGYHDDITFNDDAMTRVLELLLAIDASEPEFDCVDALRRERVSAALCAGLACVLRLQREIDGKPAVWCAQYDALTLAPSSARKMEPAALSGMESSRVLRMLMSVPRPDPALKAAVEGALAWFDAAKITDLAKTKDGGKTTYVVDTASTEVYWARFYDLATGRPIYPGRDGEIYASYAEMIAGNRGGYDYLTTLPSSVVRTGQKNWRKRLAQNPAD